MSSVTETIHVLLERPQQIELTVIDLDHSSCDRLLQLLCATRDDELSCDDVFACLDEYVDCLLNRSQMMNIPLVEHHLSLCADCRDELRALQRALALAAADD